MTLAQARKAYGIAQEEVDQILTSLCLVRITML